MEGGAVRPLSPASLPEPGHPVSSGARALGSPELARSCPRSACGWRGGWQAAPPLCGQMSLLLRVRNHGPIIRVHLNPLLVPSLGRTRLVRGRGTRQKPRRHHTLCPPRLAHTCSLRDDRIPHLGPAIR